MKIQQKRSSALDNGAAKKPTSAQTEYGELCVNFNEADPSLFIRDTNDDIRKIGGDLSLYQLKTEADDRYLRVDAGAGDQTRLSGEVTFTELTKHNDGVQLTSLTNASYLGTDASGNIVSVEGISQNDADARYLRVDAGAPDQTRVVGSVTFAETTNHQGDLILDGIKNAPALGTDANGKVIATTSSGITQDQADGRYLRIDAGAPNQTRVAGEATFARVTTHNNGVNIAGGTAVSTGSVDADPAVTATNHVLELSTGQRPDGLGYQITFKQDGKDQASINALGRFGNNLGNKPAGSACIGFESSGAIPNGVGADEIYPYRSNFSIAADNTHRTADGYGFYATTTAGLSDAGNPLQARRLGSYAGFSVTGISSAGDTTYGFYTDIDGNIAGVNAYAFYSQNNAKSYFGGLTEHKSGVTVSGGDPSTVGRGIYESNGALAFAVDGFGRATIGSTTASFYTAPNTDYAITAGQSNNTVTNFFGVNSSIETDVPNTNRRMFHTYVDPNTGVTLNRLEHYAADSRTFKGSASSVYAFKVNTSVGQGTAENYAFYGDLNSTSAGAYNFFAGGSARNFFAGGAWFDTPSKDPALWPSGGTAVGGIRLNANTASTTSANNAPIAITLGNISPVPTKYLLTVFGGSPINQLGGIRVTNTAGDLGFVNPSDYRIKTNVQSVSSVVEKIKNINVVSYTDTRFNADVPYGFIAHELQEQVPTAVLGSKDATEAIGTLTDHDGTELATEVIEPPAEEMTYEEEIVSIPGTPYQAAVYDNAGNLVSDEVAATEDVMETVTRIKTWSATGTRDVLQGVDQTKLIPLLTKALQEALEKIETLETRLSDAGIA